MSKLVSSQSLAGVSSSPSSSSSSSISRVREHHLHSISHYKHLLRVSSLAPSTMSAYSSAVSHYNHYCHQLPFHPHHCPPHPSAILNLDRCVEDYISYLYGSYAGRNKQLAVNTVYGIYAFHPEFRNTLKRSEQLLRGWDRLIPSISHPPLTWPVTVFIAIVLAQNNQVDAAIATLVAFDGLLRVGELVNLRVADVSIPGDARRGSAASPSSSSPSSSRVCLRLASTKTGRNQWAELYTPEVGLLLSLHLQHRHFAHTEYVFACPSNQRASYYRHLLKVACTGLKLDHLGFTPHSLRHGGATHAHMHLNQSIEHIMHRGRWLSNNTCRSYIQSGNAALLVQRLPSHVLSTSAVLVKEWFSILRSLCFPSSHPY